MAPESVGEFIKQGREDVRNYQRADAARQAELDKTRLVGRVGRASSLGRLDGWRSAAAHSAQTYRHDRVLWFVTCFRRDDDGESPSLAGTHTRIDAAWTYLGGKLGSTGKLANEAEGIGGKAAQWLAKFRLPTWTAHSSKARGGQAAQAVGQEASNYLADIAAGKHSFNRDDFINRMESAAAQAAPWSGGLRAYTRAFLLFARGRVVWPTRCRNASRLGRVSLRP